MCRKQIPAMAIKKQPKSEEGEIFEVANDWFRQFVKVLEFHIVEIGQGLPPDATPADCRLAVMRAVKLSLLDDGIDDDAITSLFGAAKGVRNLFCYFPVPQAKNRGASTF